MPTGTDMKRILFCVALGTAMLQGAVATHAADANATTGALQDLAVRIKRASDATAAQQEQAIDFAAFARSLQQFEAAADAQPELTRKYRAVSLLLGQLQFQLARPPGAALTAPAALDRQSLSAQHGASCTTALGLTPELPVEIALSAAGASGSDAWLRVEPDHAGHFVFATDSRGADPALAIYHGCDGGRPLAADDDTFGLDARALVAVDDRAPLLVHVTNSGGGSAVRVSVAAADATITGHVVEAGSGIPLNNVNISLYDQNGNWAYGPTAYTDSSGNYSLSTAAGQFYVRASVDQHLTTLYPNAVCPVSAYYSPYSVSNCNLPQAQMVSATSGTATAGINFALGTGQRIVGTVRDQNNLPLANMQVNLMDFATGNSLTTAYADAYGRYQFTALPNQSYALSAGSNYSFSGYGRQLYNHITCGGPLLADCNVSQATPLVVNGQDWLNIDFNLQQLASIHGTVSGPFAAFSTTIYVLNQGGSVVASSNMDQQGNYRVGPLPIGQYYVYVTSSGYFSRLYPNVDCPADCGSSLPSGTLIPITQQGQSPQVDFTLTPLPIQHGHVQDASSGLPLQGVQVLVSMTPPATFYAVASASTDAAGNFSFAAPAAGSYYVWAQSTDHIDQLYSGIACEAPGSYAGQSAHCDVTGATLMTVNPSIASLPDLNFALQASSQVSGHVSVRAAQTIAASGATVNVYDTSGTLVDEANVDASGNYALGDLTPGTYFLAAANTYYYSSYVGQVWQNIDCSSNCVPTQGTPVVVAANAHVGGIDFSLIRRDAIVGTVTDAHNAPIPGVLIDLFDANTLAYFATGVTDAQGNYLVTGNMGSAYFVATEAPAPYINQINAGVICTAGPAYQRVCPFTNASAVGLPYGSLQPHAVNFTLSLPPDEIFSATFE